VTKTAIACAALRLAARSTVDLDFPVVGDASLRALLRHEARLSCYGRLPAYHDAVAARRPAWTADEMLARCADLPPPEGWAYSNIGYLHARRALERASGLPLGPLLAREVLGPAGLIQARLGEGVEPMPHLPALARYDFGWVYHGCLIGPPSEAAAMMAAILGGRLLDANGLAVLRDVRRLGGAVPGRVWTEHGYGLGLMSGRAGPVALEGHSGGGPGSTCAVYRIGDAVVATFSTSRSEAVPERAVVRAARRP
jgi:CubicO group peptidase (beta-lactamase class C family)